MKYAISVIMPALNEEKNISLAIDNTLRALDDFNIKGEIIVINDGSRDKTEEIINEAMKKEKRVRMIIHEKPEGIGKSFWDGILCANYDAVVMLPGDNENDPWEIFRYYNLLEHIDIVIPFVFNREKRPLFRNILSFIYRFIINTTFLVNFNYTNGTILFRKSILKELDYRDYSFFFQTDILVKAVKKGYLFAEVPYRLGIRKEGISKAITFPSLFSVIRGYLHLVKSYYFSKDKKTPFSPDSQTVIRRNETNS